MLAMMYPVLSMNFEALVICSGGNVLKAVGNTGKKSWMDIGMKRDIWGKCLGIGINVFWLQTREYGMKEDQ